MALLATFTPANGIFGDLFSLIIDYDEGGANLVISIASETEVTLTIGTTGGTQNLQWDAIAALFNANVGASALAVMVGETNDGAPSNLNSNASGGAAGDGLSQFYSAPVPGPPPPVRPTRLCTTL